MHTEMSSKSSSCALTILLVEDLADLRSAIALYLEMELSGAEIHQAASGNEALRMLRSLRVDVIVSDFNMPDGNGLELFLALEVFDGLPRKFIMFTDDVEILTMKSGKFAVVGKTDLEGLVGAIRS